MTTQISETTRTVQEGGLVVTKTVEGETFDVPAIMYQVVSARTDNTEFTLYDELPAEHSRADVGFHPKYGKSNWSVDGRELIYENNIGAGEELLIAYGVRDATVGELSDTLTVPDVEVHGPAPAVESLEDVIPGVEDTNGDAVAAAEGPWHPMDTATDRLLETVDTVPTEFTAYFLRIPLAGRDPAELEQSVEDKAVGIEVVGSVVNENGDRADAIDVLIACEHEYGDLQTALEMVLDRSFHLADIDSYTQTVMDAADETDETAVLSELSSELSLPRWDDIGMEAVPATDDTKTDVDADVTPDASMEADLSVESLEEEAESDSVERESSEDHAPEPEFVGETGPGSVGETRTELDSNQDDDASPNDVESTQDSLSADPPDQDLEDVVSRIETGDLSDEERARILSALAPEDDTSPSELSALQSKVGEYATYVDAIEGFTRTAESVLSELDSEFDKVDAHLDSLEPDSESVMSALEHAQSGIATDLKGVADDLHDIESRVDARVDEVGDNVETVQGDVRDIRARHAELAERLDNVENTLDTHRSVMRDELDEVRAGLDGVRTDANDVRDELTTAIDDVSAQVEANTQWREQLSKVIASGPTED